MARRYYRTKRFYESVVVFKPTMTEDEIQKSLQEFKDHIEKKGGQILNVEDWGTRQLAYRIGNFNHGRYFLLKLQSENTQLPNELDFYCKINDNVIRWLNVQVRG